MKPPKTIFQKYSYLWITSLFFLLSLIGHWIFSWFAFVNDQKEHNQIPKVNEYIVQAMRDTLENWQSEFLQLLWQVGGLSFLLFLGSPDSKEGDERKEEKLDFILQKVDPKNGLKFIKEIDNKFGRE